MALRKNNRFSKLIRSLNTFHVIHSPKARTHIFELLFEDIRTEFEYYARSKWNYSVDHLRININLYDWDIDCYLPAAFSIIYSSHHKTWQSVVVKGHCRVTEYDISLQKTKPKNIYQRGHKTTVASHPSVNIAVQRLRVVSDSDTIKQLSWDSIERNPSPSV